MDLNELKKFHDSHGKIATVTAVHPPVRFGELEITNDRVINFEEKPQAKAGWINGGFFVLEPSVFKYIKNESTIWEKEPLEELAKNKQLTAYKHNGFWQPMDTLRDKNYLEGLWNSKNIPWKTW